MILTLDASVALKWFLQLRDNEADAGRALSILAGVYDAKIQLVEPPHFISEVAAVLAREKPDEAHDDLLDLLSIERRTVETPDIHATALDISIRYGQHLFDALYHAVALHTPGAVLVTADRRYYTQARAEGQIILLANWTPEI